MSKKKPCGLDYCPQEEIIGVYASCTACAWGNDSDTTLAGKHADQIIIDEAVADWEHGVGNGKPDEEDLDIAREYYSDLPTIDIVHCKDCKCFLNPDYHPFEFCMDYTNVNCYCSCGERK